MKLRSRVVHSTVEIRWMYLWGLTLAGVVLLSIFGRKLQSVLTVYVEPSWVAVAVFITLGAVLVWLFLRRKNRGVATWRLILFGSVIFGGGAAVYAKLLVPLEAVHFLLFSLVGFLSSMSFGPLSGMIALLSVAVGDEVLQHFLPDRVGDLHDILINSISGIAGWLCCPKR